ncbi:MAG: hypothetical protein J6S85_05800 [Methanobrevibacter sp.]|nr:hypothetical protein [Methanobrevibacter sp.]
MKKYITAEDLIKLKDTDIKIYDEEEPYKYFIFKNGILCSVNNDLNIICINVGMAFQSYGHHFYIEEAENTGKSDIGKVCIFWNEAEDKDSFLDILGALMVEDEYQFYAKKDGSFWKHCRRLTKDEIEKYL